MNTGADDDSRSTPTLALSGSWQWPSEDAAATAVKAIRPAITRRVNPVIPLPPSLLQAFGHGLVSPDERTPLLQRLLQLFHRDVARNRVAAQRQCSGRSRRLPHGKTGAGDPRCRLAVMGHR